MLRISSPPPVILSQCITQVQEINLLKLLTFAPYYREPKLDKRKTPSSSQCVLKGFCHVGFGVERTYGEGSVSVSRADFSPVKDHREV